MSKPWLGHGLSDFDSWWTTELKRGLVYRGDVDMEFMDSHHRITVLEFKNAGERLSKAQLAWLRVRAKQPNTEVRVVREVPGEDVLNPLRDVRVWNPIEGHDVIMPLQEFRAWCESRAYRPGR